MKKNLNPKSHKRLKGDTSNSWSDLPFDLLVSVFERLTFVDFQRAKSVCSSWRSSSKQCVLKNHTPWMLLFPENNQTNSCMLFNPEEKDKLYKTQDLGSEFASSTCVKTYGSWLLMQNLQSNIYIVNLFTQERIYLPPVDSQFGMVLNPKIMDTGILSHVFWIDDKTKDHVVAWLLSDFCVVYSKTGDNSWNPIQLTSSCRDMVYKDHKLYLSIYSDKIKIFDFSRDISQQIPKQTCVVTKERHSLLLYQLINSYSLGLGTTVTTKLVVTVKGDVLKVVITRIRKFGSWSFRLYKVYSLGLFKNNEEVCSLGDEAMFLDLGITVLANDKDGIRRNSIYFSGSKSSNNIFVFNLETGKMEKLHKIDPSSVQLSSKRWFLPSFTKT